MPYNVLSTELRNKIWLMYLRKSRQDDPNETVEEVLEKHEAMLQEWAERELGRRIPEENIYREVISGGESIDEREEIRKVLSKIEDPNVAGVICRDPQRLTRGSLEDCGRLISTLLYTNTMVATQMMTFDLHDKRDLKFFESELMRGRDYLDYFKEIQNAGRVAAVKRGNFIASKPPFGYDKITIGKDRTLVQNKDADVVRMIFDWYVNERVGYQSIANRLNDMGIKPVSTDIWLKNTIANMLHNIQYDGKVCYNRKKTITVIKDGKVKKSRPMATQDKMIIVEGKHPAIIDHDMFMAAQQIIDNHPRVKADKVLKNAFAGIMFCSHCKKALYYNAVGGTRPPRLECRRKPAHFKSVRYDEVVPAVTYALEHSELPNLEVLQKNNAGTSIAIQQQLINRLEEEMRGYREQEENQYELLETKKYTQELFDKRNAVLRKKMDECEEKLKKARASLPNAINYEEKIIQLKDAIQALKDDSITPEDKNRFLKAIIDRIEIETIDNGIKNTEIKMDIFLKI